MTNLLLTYQTPAGDQLHGRRTSAWIASLVLGILHCLSGLGIVFRIAILTYVDVRSGRPIPSYGEIAVFTGTIFLYVAGTGVLLIFGARSIRRGSRGWAISCLAIASVHAAVTLILIIGILTTAVLFAAWDRSSTVGLLFSLIPAAANLSAAILIYRTLRHPRPICPIDPDLKP